MMYPAMMPAKSGRVGRIFGWSATGILLSLLLISIMVNVYLAVFVRSMTSDVREVTYQPGDSKQRIVILPIVGVIDEEMSHFVTQAVQSLRRKHPAAIVLRVNSGGGGVGASDRIWNQLQILKEELDIPIVASMGSAAASGGYYVLASADHIFAEPTTITGSIGVMAQGFTFNGSLDKLGITPETLIATRSDRKDLGNPWRSWTENDRVRIRQLLDTAYERFVKVVHTGRREHMTLEAVRQTANGDIFTLSDALANKLVDEEGYISDAINKAKTLAGMPPAQTPHVTLITRPASLTSLLSSSSSMIDRLNTQTIRNTLIELAVPRLEYR